MTDLVARQQGASVMLNFTLPEVAVNGESLDATPDIEVYRGAAPAAGAKPQTALVLTVPSAAVDTYLRAGKIEISDALDAATMKRGGGLVYVVRTGTSKKRASADSNFAPVKLLLAPQAPAEFRGNVTESAIELTWTAPTADAAGAPLGAVVIYHVYRGESDPTSPAIQNLEQAKLKVPLGLIGSSSETSFRDEHFTFGANYVYTVRAAIAQAESQKGKQQNQSVESGDSTPLILTPKDVFPPSAPSGLVAAIIPGTDEQPAYVELSWEANSEADLAGYWVYRSEDSGTQGQRINAESLLSPSARDTTVVAGKRYFYRIAAVDQAGNESPASTAIVVDVPQK